MHGLRHGAPEVVRPVLRVRGVEHARRGGRRDQSDGRRHRARWPSSSCSTTSTPCSPRPSRPASASSTGCSTAVSCPARSPCSAASRASARARCCCSCSPGGPAPSLYISAEESPQQVRIRAERLGAVRAELVAGGRDVARRRSSTAIDRAGTAARRRSTASRRSPTTRLSSPPGSIAAGSRRAPSSSSAEAKRRGVAIVLVGHVTKDGALAGPRVLEHVVDTVLSFEGDRHHALRLLRAVKHRFGSTDELGLFEMTGSGLTGVPDPSQLFLADRRSSVPGSVVVPAMDGRRPLLVEVQSLTVPVPPGVPARRNAQGVDNGRLALLLAVLERRAGVRVADHDVYASIVGGVRLTEPATDLAVGARRGQRRKRPPHPRGRRRHRRDRPRWRGAPGHPRQATARRSGADGVPTGHRAGRNARRRRHRSWCGCAPSPRRSARRQVA